jgi:hypothetical protein
VPGFSSDSPLARDLIRIGDEAIAHADDLGNSPVLIAEIPQLVECSASRC